MIKIYIISKSKIRLLFFTLLSMIVFFFNSKAGYYSGIPIHSNSINERMKNGPEKEITGIVVDEGNNPLHGVTISVKGSNIGTITDLEGRFVLSASESDTLIVSYLGYQTEEVLVKNNESFNITLTYAISELDEMIVVGYGKQSRREITGSISQVEMKKTEHLPNTNLTETLRGRVAGVQFTTDTRPGQNGTILIQGQRSLSASNAPLIVLDGAVFNGTISDINPQDVESMEILKDASATAIYGARAANGVVLVTSKKGMSDRPSIRFNSYLGFSDFSYKPELLTPGRYIQFIKDYNSELGNQVTDRNILQYLPANVGDNYKNNMKSDPWDVVSQDAVNNSLNLSLSGKSNSFNYYLSGSRSNEQGLIMNDQQKRTSVNVNFNVDVTKWMTLGLSSNYSNRDLSGAVPNIEQVARSIPYSTWKYEDGSPRRFVVDGENVSRNPLWEPSLIRNEQISKNLFANIYADIKLPFLEGLMYQFRYAPNVRWTHTYEARKQDPKENEDLTSAKKLNREAEDWMIENLLKYDRQISTKHKIGVTLLYGSSHRGFENTTASAERFSPDVTGWNNLNLGEDQHTFSNAELTYNQISYMARINYGFSDKYLLTLTTRRDGSSVFAKDNKYGTFPSAAFAWIVSDESFVNDVNKLDFLKIRFSYGAVGNQAISPYESLSLLGTAKYIFGNPSSTFLGVYPLNMSNSGLKWETSYKTNLGIDFNILGDRISGSFDIYNTKTKDLLMKRSLPRMTGFTSVQTNLGEINNKGVNISINSLNINSKNFEWRSELIFSTNKNKIIHLYFSDVDGDGKEDDDVGNNWFIGQPISIYYDYIFDGIFQNDDEILKSAQPNAFPGDVRLKDIDEDEEITPSDRMIVGQKQPKYTWSLSNSFKYKNFTLSFFINAMSGSIGAFPRSISAGRSLNFVDRGWWTPDNNNNTMPSISYQNQYGFAYYLSRDFIRLQDATFSYKLPNSVLSKIGLTHCSFYVSGKNLYTLTKWKGPDPESGYSTLGNFYPLARTFVLGIDFGL